MTNAALANPDDDPSFVEELAARLKVARARTVETPEERDDRLMDEAAEEMLRLAAKEEADYLAAEAEAARQSEDAREERIAEFLDELEFSENAYS